MYYQDGYNVQQITVYNKNILTCEAVGFSMATVDHGVQYSGDVVLATGGEFVVVWKVSLGGARIHDVIPRVSPRRAVRRGVMLKEK